MREVFIFIGGMVAGAIIVWAAMVIEQPAIDPISERS